MVFLNKKTGLQWEISDASLIHRLKNNPDKEQPKVSTAKEKSNGK